MISQSIRLSVAENKLLREAAATARQSINSYCLTTLLAAAKKTIAAAATDNS
jgi:uncharacterized protein (DUF1778 family)